MQIKKWTENEIIKIGPIFTFMNLIYALDICMRFILKCLTILFYFHLSVKKLRSKYVEI